MQNSSSARVDASLAVVMISLNEAHNMQAVIENIAGIAQEIFVVDSFSSDNTIQICRDHGVHVVQRRFEGFGDQWNYAMRELPITARWTMKLDPDERISPKLADSIHAALAKGATNGFTVNRRLWFMGGPLPVHQRILRIWRTGTCRFSDVLVNEHPLVSGPIGHLEGNLEHHDSPNLQHWIEKQNLYTTAEARTIVEGLSLAAKPRIWGSALERRMWLKRNYRRVPGRHLLMMLYCYLWLGTWRSGRRGLIWSRLRADIYRLIDYKVLEMKFASKTDSSEG